MTDRNTGWGVHFGTAKAAPESYGRPVRKRRKNREMTTAEKIEWYKLRLELHPESTNAIETIIAKLKEEL